MLTVTTAAADALDDIVAATNGAPDGAGVRVVEAAPTVDGGPSFGLAIVAEPQPTDQVVDTGKTPVFVDVDAAAMLEDKVLDATVSGESVGFTISEQP